VSDVAFEVLYWASWEEHRMHDAIVVGARCAGSAIAMLLAQRGHRVLLVDRDSFPSDMAMSTHFVHQRGMACLARWGLRDQVVATESRPVTHVDIDIGAFTLSGAAPSVDGEVAGFAPRRILLDEILVRTAVASGAELWEGCRVESVLTDDGRVVGVAGVTPSGSRFSEKARIVIGADGPSSRVASEVRAAEYKSKAALQGTAWIYWDDVPLPGLELHLREHEAIYAFPTSNGSTLVGANWSIDRFRLARRDIEASYFDLLRRAAPALADRADRAKRADDRMYLGSTRNFFRKACGPGWALIGDAHHKKDPCTAQGITDAFCDAELLAQSVDRSLRGECDLMRSLEDYEAARVNWLMPFFELTCQMATFAPPAPDMLALYGSLRGNQEDTDAFIGLITEAISPTQFFAPENIHRILNRAATQG
jgi:2-polyprenyl-6-methoxyphenol hydroxylase-like FAD-dependent oxidoreductase